MSNAMVLSQRRKAPKKQSLIERLGQIIASVDLEPIEIDLCINQGWSLARTESAAVNFRRHWYLSVRRRGKYFVPSFDADEFLHRFLVLLKTTEEYQNACTAIADLLGENLDWKHVEASQSMSQDQERLLKAQRLRTLRQFRILFKEDPYSIGELEVRARCNSVMQAA